MLSGGGGVVVCDSRGVWDGASWENVVRTYGPELVSSMNKCVKIEDILLGLSCKKYNFTPLWFLVISII